MGDLNDEVEAATTQILNGPTGSGIDTAAPVHAGPSAIAEHWYELPTSL